MMMQTQQPTLSEQQFQSEVADRKYPVIADRYKTRMCRTYENGGVCPYESKCMFAHGEHELRTSEMNLADGLISEDAIKQFQRQQLVNKQLAYVGEVAAMRAYYGTNMPPPPPAYHNYPMYQSGYDHYYGNTGVCECPDCQAASYPPTESYYYGNESYETSSNASSCQCAECMAAYKTEGHEHHAISNMP